MLINACFVGDIIRIQLELNGNGKVSILYSIHSKDNPVDDPDELFEAAINNHRQLIKQMKGVPGVIPERYEEAFTIKHCALSLVGEPITYPYINRFVDLLHSKGISSFMVTNAQFPDKIVCLETSRKC